MSPTSPVFYVTPDGVSRPVRLTFGARKRIAEKFGKSFAEVMRQYDSAALPDILYCCMWDDLKGKPPEGLPPNWGDSIEPDGEMENEMQAVFLQALAKGRVEKNALKALIRELSEKQMRTSFGSIPGASPVSAFASPSTNSGASPSASSTPSANDSESESEPSTSAPA